MKFIALISLLLFSFVNAKAATYFGVSGDVWTTFETDNNYDGKLTIINTGSVEIEAFQSVNLPPWIAGYSLKSEPSFIIEANSHKEFTIYYWGSVENLEIVWSSGSTKLQSGTMPIPEPSTALLGCLGVLFLIRRNRTKF